MSSPSGNYPWRKWGANPALRAAARPPRTQIIEARLAHGQTELVRAGHVEWDDESSPRFVNRWRRYYP